MRGRGRPCERFLSLPTLLPGAELAGVPGALDEDLDELGGADVDEGPWPMIAHLTSWRQRIGVGDL